MIIPRICFCAAIMLTATCAFGQRGDDLTKFDAAGDDTATLKLMEKGLKLIQAGKFTQAIEEYFDKIIESLESEYDDEDVRYFCARTKAEAKAYRQASGNDGKVVTILSDTWSMAYYMKAYSLIELDRHTEAMENLSRAITLSPLNAQYLSEMGHLYSLSRDWEKSLELFLRAAEGAETVSPERIRMMDLTRAWRGVGYAYIELKKYDEAEEMYRKCLDLNPDDDAAKQELEYIDQMRSERREETPEVNE